MTQARTYGEMVEAGTPQCEVFNRVVDLHLAVQAPPVKGRLWRYAWTHDGHEYQLAMNGRLDQDVEGVPPLHVLIERDGWAAVLCDMFAGQAIGGPDIEADVLAAIAAEIGSQG